MVTTTTKHCSSCGEDVMCDAITAHTSICYLLIEAPSAELHRRSEFIRGEDHAAYTPLINVVKTTQRITLLAMLRRLENSAITSWHYRVRWVADFAELRRTSFGYSLFFTLLFRYAATIKESYTGDSQIFFEFAYLTECSLRGPRPL